jgi:hypothetical protein
VGAKQVRVRGLLLGWSTHRIADEITGEVPGLLALEAYRLASGWTREQLSTAIDALYQHDGLRPPRLASSEICGWEHGRRMPGAERREYLTRVYRTRPDRLGFGRDHSPAPEPPRPAVRPPRPTGTGLGEQDAELATARLNPAEPALVDSLRALTDAYVASLDCTAPSKLEGRVRAHLRLAQTALARGRPDARAMEVVVGEAHVLAGMLAFLRYNLGEARAHYATARRLARQAADASLEAYTLTVEPLLHFPMHYERSPRNMPVAVAMLERASEMAKHLRPPQLVRLHGRRAQAYAVDGDATNCERELDRAWTALTRCAAPDRPAGFGVCSELTHLAFESECRVLLGQPARAEGILVNGLRRLDPDRVMWRLLRTADLGRAHLALGDLDEGARLLGDAFEGGAAIGLELAMERARGHRCGIPWMDSEPSLRVLDERLSLV